MPDPESTEATGGPVVGCTLFVFHDGSPTGLRSVQAARSLAPAVDLSLDVVDHVVSSDDFSARNRLIAKSRGSYVAVLDHGGVPDPDWLARSIRLLREDPTLGMVATAGDDDDTEASFVIDPPADAFVCRRTMWKAVGGYDELVSPGAQGLGLGWRCWLLGWRASEATMSGHESPPSAPPSRDDLERLCRLLVRDASLADDRGLRSRFSEMQRTRTHLQRERRRPDGEIGVLLRRAFERDGAATGLADVLAAGGWTSIVGDRRRIVVATADTLAETMAGPGIRAWRIAAALSDDHEVHLVTTGACSLVDDRFPVEAVDHDRFHELASRADVVVFQGWVMADRPWLAQLGVVIVADIYDPMHLEQLEQGKEAPAEGGRWLAIAGANETLNQQLRRGDYFLCASAKQRDLWLGQLAAVGRVNQVLYDEDNAFESRMRIAPFGLDADGPVQHRHAIRGEVDGIGADDEVILWGGGIYNWFDPLTLIRAVDALRTRRPGLRLYFLGTKHPNPEIPVMRMAAEARSLASQLDLDGSHVFFNDGWVPFAERADYLLDADVAVSIHRAHVETEFSFRTRLLDYLWCGLPVVATKGDSFEPVIDDHEIGITVEPGDVDALVDALDALLSDPERRASCAANARTLATSFRWDDALAPVQEICRRPVRAPDVACPDTASTFGVSGPPPAWREDLALARRYLTEGGVTMLAQRVRSRVERLRTESD